MPRPPRLTPAVATMILNNLAAGASVEVAAAAAGVGSTTVYTWKARGQRESTGRYREFWEALRAREAQVQLSLAATVRQAMPTDWRAAAWMLERRWPNDWGRHDKVTLIRAEVDRLARALDLDADEIIAEAERLTREENN